MPRKTKKTSLSPAKIMEDLAGAWRARTLATGVELDISAKSPRETEPTKRLPKLWERHHAEWPSCWMLSQGSAICGKPAAATVSSPFPARSSCREENVRGCDCSHPSGRMGLLEEPDGSSEERLLRRGHQCR